jgi:hypothetical protein
LAPLTDSTVLVIPSSVTHHSDSFAPIASRPITNLNPTRTTTKDMFSLGQVLMSYTEGMIPQKRPWG